MNSTRDEGAAGTVAVATSAKKKQGKKAPGGLQTLKISNNFGSTGRRNLPQAAKLDGGGSKLGMPRKRPAEGTPRQKGQGGNVKFPFRLDREMAYATQSAKAKPPTIAAKYDDSDDRANQRATNGHGKAGASNVPVKDRHGCRDCMCRQGQLGRRRERKRRHQKTGVALSLVGCSQARRRGEQDPMQEGERQRGAIPFPP
jgi:hypothetical protein